MRQDQDTAIEAAMEQLIAHGSKNMMQGSVAGENTLPRISTPGRPPDCQYQVLC